MSDSPRSALETPSLTSLEAAPDDLRFEISNLKSPSRHGHVRSPHARIEHEGHSRLWQHRNPERSSFSQRYHCVHLLYVEHYDDVKAAIAREKQLKGWRRAKKVALIEKQNPHWEDLSEQ